MSEESISAMKDSTIEGLKASNDDLQHKVKKLEEMVECLEKGIDCENIKWEKDLQAALQYDRLNSIAISGLENKSIDIINKVNTTKVTACDIEACHRLGKKRGYINKICQQKGC